MTGKNFNVCARNIFHFCAPEEKKTEACVDQKQVDGAVVLFCVGIWPNVQITNNLALNLGFAWIKPLMNSLDLNLSVMHACVSESKTLPRQTCTLYQSSAPRVLIWQGACTGDTLTRYFFFSFFFFLPWMLLATAPPPRSVRLRYSHVCRHRAGSASAATHCVVFFPF